MQNDKINPMWRQNEINLAHLDERLGQWEDEPVDEYEPLSFWDICEIYGFIPVCLVPSNEN